MFRERLDGGVRTGEIGELREKGPSETRSVRPEEGRVCVSVSTLSPGHISDERNGP